VTTISTANTGPDGRDDGLPGDEPASLGDDLAKLWSALTGMVGDVQTAVNTAAPGCTTLPACPLCRATSVVTNLPPEVKEHLASAASSLFLALAAAAASLNPEPDKSGFQRIKLGDETDPPGDPA
jgi:hypothetical protein